MQKNQEEKNVHTERKHFLLILYSVHGDRLHMLHGVILNSTWTLRNFFLEKFISSATSAALLCSDCSRHPQFGVVLLLLHTRFSVEVQCGRRESLPTLHLYKNKRPNRTT